MNFLMFFKELWSFYLHICEKTTPSPDTPRLEHNPYVCFIIASYHLLVYRWCVTPIILHFARFVIMFHVLYMMFAFQFLLREQKCVVVS
jgi:hypothetical protein